VIPAVLRRPATAIAAALLVALLGACLFGSGGLLYFRRLRAERRVLGEEAFGLLVKNDALRQRILRLRSDRALERLARQELGLVRDGEIVYRFHNRTDPAPRSAARGN
jgi:cell division protein FtsB